MNNIARNGTATKNNRAAALATRHAISRPLPKSTEEQDLEWDYEQLLQHKKPEGKMDQLTKWVNPSTMAAACIFGYIESLIFQKTGLAELTAYVGFLGALVIAAKYVVDSLSESTSMLKQLPAILAKVPSRLRTEISEAVEQQKTEILELGFHTNTSVPKLQQQRMKLSWQSRDLTSSRF
ncbi:hypothetical protein NADE_005927 [Nannochloris sp. 'desiccata']|nr:hypothetical protein NADE_005927 [Chlorella desiccata (nom. nud.)]